MPAYRLVLKPSVEKDLRHVPKPVISRLLAHIEALQDSPFPRQSLKLTGAEQL